MDADLAFHGQIYGRFQGFDEVIAAVGVAAVVGLADAGDEVGYALLLGVDGGGGEEN